MVQTLVVMDTLPLVAESRSRWLPTAASSRSSQKDWIDMEWNAFACKVAKSSPFCNSALLSDDEYTCRTTKILNSVYLARATFWILGSGVTCNI